MQMKSVMLTEDEITYVIANYGYKLGNKNFTDEDIERINYLNKRLKSFKEPEEKVPEAKTMTGTEVKQAQAVGWGDNAQS